MEEPRAVNVENRVEARSVPVKVHHGILLLIKVLHIFLVVKNGLTTPLLLLTRLFIFERGLDLNPERRQLSRGRPSVFSPYPTFLAAAWIRQ